ncbi:hypothetical protein [Nevskia soli]|uniref:hypothetical protein n=1 Tax=Nevskia soli TaxID=418856 RepID=UPI0015D6E1C0|nr:hypothetical protein [Nevskia soli]
MFLALILLLSTPASEAQLLNDSFDVPAREYRFIPMHIANWPATLDLAFNASENAPVRVELVTRRDLDRFIRGKPYEYLLRLSARPTSDFRQPVPDAGDYDVLLINEGSRDSAVKVRAAVQFAREPDVAQYVPPARRAILISVSVVIFLIALLWSGLALLRAMRSGAGHL